jgi:transposase InsO family protein
VQLLREMSNLRKEPSESLTTFLDRARVLHAELTAAGQIIEEFQVVTSVLAGLPAEYNVMVTILTSSATSITLNDLLPKLLIVEQQSPATSEEHAFFARGSQHRSKPPGHRGDKQQETRTCHYCKKVGHLAADCRKKKADLARGSTGMSAQAVAMTAGPETSSKGPASWAVDSGASRHITPYRELLVDYTVLRSGVDVTFGNGQTATAAGTGSIKLTTGGAGNAIVLQDVLYVPQATCNLFSVKQATSKGVEAVFNVNTCDITYKGKLMIKAVSGGGLYTFTAVYQEPVGAMLGETAELWHRRFGHLGYDNLAKLVAKGMVNGINVKEQDVKAAKDKLCEPCVHAKQHRRPFPASTSTKVVKPLQLIHMDLMGPLPVPTLGGAKYVATFLDDFSGISVVKLLAHKSGAAAAIKETFTYLENQCDFNVKAVRTDRGGEYLNNDLRSYFNSKGIEHQTTAPYTPQQNGAAERLNRTLMDRVRAMLLEARLPKDLWGEAIVTANHVRNRSPSTEKTKTPWELFYGTKPDVSYFRVFGSAAYVHVAKHRRSKLDAQSVKGILVGYNPSSKAYRVLLEDRSIVISTDVIFEESSPTSAEEETAPPAATLGDDDSSQEEEEPAVDEEMEDAEQPPPAGQRYPRQGAQRQPRRPWWVVGEGASPTQQDTADNPAGQRRRVNVATVNIATTPSEEPQTYEQAIQSGDPRWIEAMDDEMKSLLVNGTWTLEKLPPGVRSIPWTRPSTTTASSSAACCTCQSAPGLTSLKPWELWRATCPSQPLHTGQQPRACCGTCLVPRTSASPTGVETTPCWATATLTTPVTWTRGAPPRAMSSCSTAAPSAGPAACKQLWLHQLRRRSTWLRRMPSRRRCGCASSCRTLT